MKLRSLANFFGSKLSSGFWTEQRGQITTTSDVKQYLHLLYPVMEAGSVA